MDHYIDIQVLATLEFSDSILLNNVFDQLHKALVQSNSNEIGISFPLFQKTLGSLLRLHGHKAALGQLMSLTWTRGLVDYVSISDILQVPENARHRSVKRIQAKNSSERLIRRSVKKGWLTEEEARHKFMDRTDNSLSQPYLRAKSGSTGQMFRLFIEHGPIVTTPKLGTFNSYGLSSDATIPWFEP